MRIATSALVVAVLPVLAAPTAAGVRVFMAPDGQQATQPMTGPTSIHMPSGSTVELMMWIEDTQQLETFNGYQTILRWFATLESGQGTLEYVDVNPGGGSGDSFVVDASRPDWVLATQLTAPAVYMENAPPAAEPAYGTFETLAVHTAGVPVNGLRYLASFKLKATKDTCGVFQLAFVPAGQGLPGTAMFKPFGAEFQVDEYQPLTVRVGAYPEPYGDACITAAGGSPALDVTGCAAGGKSFTIDVTDGPPNRLAFLFIGLNDLSAPLNPGCDLQNLPILPAPIVFSTPSSGEVSLPAAIPVNPPSVDVYLQCLFDEPPAPNGASSTNPLKLHIE